jgi:predicted Zn-dependent protease
VAEHRHLRRRTGPPGEWQAQPTLLFAEAVELADRALEVAVDVARAGGARDAEISVGAEVGESSLTRFAGSAIHQNVTEDVLAVRLTVTVGGRTATVRGSGSDPALLRRLAVAALDAARVQPADPDWPGLAPPAPAEPMEHIDAATAMAAPAERAEVVRAFLDAAEGLDCAGFCSTRGTTTAFVNSAGQRLADSTSFAALDGVARAALLPGEAADALGADGASGGVRPGLADGAGRRSAIALADIDAHAVGTLAARTARAAAADPVDVDPGSWPVVLRPSAVSDVLAFLTVYGLTSRAVAEGRSFAKPGEQQLDPSLTLVCDPLDPRLPALPFDAEGTPRRTYELVREGVTTELAADRRDARRAGTESNGGSLSGGASSGGIAPAVGLHPGSLAEDELLGGLGRALLVHDFWYTRVLDPRPLVVTGLTRNGVFLVEDGVVVGPARNVRFTQSYADALAPGNVLGLGDNPELFGDPGMSFLAPSLALRSWNVTGNAQG